MGFMTSRISSCSGDGDGASHDNGLALFGGHGAELRSIDAAIIGRRQGLIRCR